jgi:hypothetical protein
MADSSFASALAASSPDQFLRLEQEAAHVNDRFTDIDRFAANLIGAALSGSKIVDIAPGRRADKHADVLTLVTVTELERPFLDHNFALEVQQARGAWFLPEQASLKAITINLPAYLRHQPWHAITLATEDVARVHLASTTDALAAWALLIPLFNTLLAPITERAVGSTLPGAEQQATWTAILDAYQRLGIDTGPVVSVFAYRGGWSNLDRAEQAQARVALLDVLAHTDLLQVAARFRAQRVQTLVAATMKKARHGTPLARQVLTKVLQPVLSAYFSGDWLAFMDYLRMPPNANEEVITALPTPRLYVGGSTKAASVAVEHGLGVDDVNAMLAAFLGQETSTSPVEQRVDVLSRWWAQFEAIHARQTTGMPTLWGLVEDGLYFVGYGQQGPVPQLYQRLMTPELVAEVNQLWDGITLPRWPHTIVSEPYPHKLMAETLGPAVAVWHGIALTAWYVCEGPYSRTPLSGLRTYHENDLAMLAEAGAPIHTSLFDELEDAERYLGPPQDLETHVQELQLPDGNISLRFSGGGQRRDGFEILRDINTRHCRWWTDNYLAAYLRSRWTQELTAVARELHRTIAAKGKTPTFRQFARFAALAANHWFNGDVASLYTAIGEKAPATPRRVDLLPIGAHDFINAVYTALGGKPYDEQLRITDFEASDRFRQMSRLATASIYYLQITEALDRVPEPTEFGVNRHEWEWAGGLDKGWRIFQDAIEQVRSNSHR